MEKNNEGDGASDNYILVIDAPKETIEIKKHLVMNGYKVLLAETITKAEKLYKIYSIKMLFISLALIDTGAVQLIKNISQKRINHKKNSQVAVILLVNARQDQALHDCMIAGADDFIIKPFTKNILLARMHAIEQLLDVKRLEGDATEEQKIARDIFDAAIKTTNIEIKGMRKHCQPANVFSGDMVLTGKHPSGDVYILFADLTGHGLSAAIAVLPVSNMFSHLIRQGDQAEAILQHINTQLLDLLPTDMFMACCMLKINVADKTVSAWNAGMPDVYIIDRYLRSITKRFSSIAIPLGINELAAEDIHFDSVKINAAKQIFMLSDGVTDSMNEAGCMFGVRRLENILQNNLSESNLFNHVINAFKHFKSDSRIQDDVTLISIALKEMLNISDPVTNSVDVSG